ncbi:MAG: type II toxin-antitoxin system PemK/MazF family toxin [Sterolibacteriaceae bacterium MAG5]|nr:type II toxin-antitoxin system PemK/MazF family toxin [Candidatus Nitricoxidireducens bremensis]
MSEPRRGDLVTVAIQGDFGKPRPALVIQSDLFNEAHPTVMLCLLSSDLRDAPLFRLTVAPTAENGLKRESQIQIDKVMTVLRDKLGPPFGRLDDAAMLKVNRALALFMGIA